MGALKHLTRNREVRVAVLGAGLGGIATAVNLKRSGSTSFTVFERSSGPGGVWWENTYPGCEVDVPSEIYSYSFMPHRWETSHATQAALQRYIELVIDHFGIRSHIRFDTTVESAIWDPAQNGWIVTTERGTAEYFDVVVTALGLLSEPNLPTWPGIEVFQPSMFHTARYEHSHDLRGKRVAVVGTGSTACQLVPALAPVVGQLIVYQREPGYVLPKRTHKITEPSSAWARSRLGRKLHRLQTFRETERLVDAFRVGSPAQLRTESYYKRYLERTVTDPALRSLLTPSYAFGCKRPVFSSDFYPALNSPHVKLVPHAVSHLTKRGIVDASGVETDVDVLIAATGFKATDFLSSVRIVGPGGVDLRDRWASGARAFLGVTVPGFPNSLCSMVRIPTAHSRLSLNWSGSPNWSHASLRAFAVATITRWTPDQSLRNITTPGSSGGFDVG